MLNEKEGRIAIWVGNIAKKSQFTAYMKETYSDEDDEKTPLNQFCAEMGDTFYDHDFVFGEYYGAKPQPLEKLLSGWSHAHSFLSGALKLAKKADLQEANTILIAYDHELKPAKWPQNSLVRFLGNLPYSDEPPPLPKQKAREVRGHRGSACCLCFSPDGRSLVSGDDEGTLIAWDVESGNALAPPRSAFKGGLADIYHLNFSSDGRRCLAATISASCLWDPFPEAKKFTPLSDQLACTKMTPDGKFGLGVNSRGIWVFNLATQKPEPGVIDGDGFAILPGDRVATAVFEKSQLCIWDVTRAKLLNQFDCSVPVREVVASPNGRWAVLHRRNQAVLWDLQKETALAPIEFESDVDSVLIPNDESWIVCLREQPLQQRSLSDGKVIRTFGSAKPGYRRIAVSAGRLLAQAFNRTNVELFELATGKCLGRFPDKEKVDPKELIDSAALSPDSQNVVIGLRSGEVRFLALEGGKFGVRQ